MAQTLLDAILATRGSEAFHVPLKLLFTRFKVIN